MENSKFSKVCFDANIFPKLFIKEEYCELAAAVYENIIKKSVKIIEPAFLKIEFYSVIRKKVYFDKLVENKARQIIALFEKLDINYIQETNKLLQTAYEFAGKLDLTVVYDCIYLAAANQQNAKFITADEKFAKRAKKIYKNILSLSSIE
jgi:predicted nucleic acid-binding protein